jgi:hypothetical protein
VVQVEAGNQRAADGKSVQRGLLAIAAAAERGQRPFGRSRCGDRRPRSLRFHPTVTPSPSARAKPRPLVPSITRRTQVELPVHTWSGSLSCTATIAPPSLFTASPINGADSYCHVAATCKEISEDQEGPTGTTCQRNMRGHYSCASCFLYAALKGSARMYWPVFVSRSCAPA